MSISISHESLTELVKVYAAVNRGNVEPFYNSHLITNIERYLYFLGVQSTIVEEGYIDTHILADYCGHYGWCFFDYERKCVRLHFFDRFFSKDDFNRVLTSNDAKTSIEQTLGSYKGYIVLRKIPGSVFGKICLALDKKNLTSGKIISKLYETHLCGLAFAFHSVAFQEQDHAISACATVALWMAFNAFPGIQPRDVISPYSIFEIVAKQHVDLNLSPVVGKGLNVAQISSVIKEQSLEALSIHPNVLGHAKDVTRAYLEMSLPIILGVELLRRTEIPSPNYSLGKHAVTVIGFDGTGPIVPYRERITSSSDEQEVDLYLESANIKELIVHDDQIGPYTKMVFPHDSDVTLNTEWVDSKGGHVDARIEVMTVINHPKVRIRFSSILYICRELNKFLYNIYRKEGWYISWDIYLTTVQTLKEKIRLRPEIEVKDKVKALMLPLPRYIWVISMYGYNEKDYNGSRFEILSHYFDATDIESSGFYLFSLNFKREWQITKVAMETGDLSIQQFCPSNMLLRDAYSKVNPEKSLVL